MPNLAAPLLLLLLGPWLAVNAVTGPLSTGRAKFSRTDQLQLQHLRPNRSSTTSLPVVLWHGMGDSCCDSSSIGGIAKLIREELGVFVHSIATGNGEMGDVLSGFWGDVNDQVARVCSQLRSMPELKGGYNAVGFSQGGQFLRAVVQRCQHTGPRMHTLVTLGAQHQGVMNVPGCRTLPLNSSHGACHVMQRLLGSGAYLPYIRDHVVQAQYFKDPYRLEEYLACNPFLPDINNERGGGGGGGGERNPLYATNLGSLERLVLYRFEDDYTVVPRDSAWFSFFDGSRLVALREQPLYTEDWLGLRRLDEAGRLEMDEVAGAAHMQFSLQWFEEQVVERWLRGGAGGEGKRVRARAGVEAKE